VFNFFKAVIPPVEPTVTEPCIPSPCGKDQMIHIKHTVREIFITLYILKGPNSVCQVVSGQAKCGCQAGMIGLAPNCRPECAVNSDCPSNKACVNQKCIDPCPGSCGSNTDCRVISHSPVCSCITGYTGDAFSDCRPVPAVGECLKCPA